MNDDNRQKSLPHGSKSSVLTMTFEPIGRFVLRVIGNLGASGIFFSKALASVFRPHQLHPIVLQLYYIGAKSVGITALVALFTGMVLGLQLYYTLVKFGSVGALGSAVALSLVREFGPVFTAVMVTARAGSAMTAEIGIQRISEQIDALVTMRIDPLAYLVSPRIVAALISLPLLTAMFDIIGMAGGFLSGVVLAGADPGTYLYKIQASLDLREIMGGFIKSLVFAALVSTTCCYHGFFTHMRKDGHGSKSVSLSTTTAVVQSCVFILIADYVVTSFLL